METKTLMEGEQPEGAIGYQKYILVQDGNGKETVISLPLGYHADIASEYAWRYGKEESWGSPEGDLEFEVLGGGRITLNPERKTISLYDRSVDYGREPRERTVEILQEAYPEYKIKQE